MRDALCLLADGQSLTSGTTAISSNVITLTPHFLSASGFGADPSMVGGLVWHLLVTVAPVGPTSVEVKLVTDSTANLATSPTPMCSTGLQLVGGTNLSVGTHWQVRLASTFQAETFLGNTIATTGSAFSAFTFSSWIDREVQFNKTSVLISGMKFN